MEFNKSRVYTAVNADELKIGSRVILGDSLSELRKEVEAEKEAAIQNLMIIHGENMSFRFTGDKYHSGSSLAYLIEPPAKPKYKPFESVESAMETIKQHGGWVRATRDDSVLLIFRIAKNGVAICGGISWVSYGAFFEEFVFADDDSPCGELVEETK